MLPSPLLRIVLIIFAAEEANSCVAYRFGFEFSQTLPEFLSKLQSHPQILQKVTEKSTIPEQFGIKYSFGEPFQIVVLEFADPTLLQLQTLVSLVVKIQNNPIPHFLPQKSLLLILTDLRKITTHLEGKFEAVSKFPMPIDLGQLRNEEDEQLGFILSPQVIIVDNNNHTVANAVCYTCLGAEKIQQITFTGSISEVYEYSYSVNRNGRQSPSWLRTIFPRLTTYLGLEEGFRVPQCYVEGPSRKPSKCIPTHVELRQLSKTLNITLELSKESDDPEKDFNYPGLHIWLVISPERMTTPIWYTDKWYNPFWEYHQQLETMLYYCRFSMKFQSPSWYTLVRAFDKATWLGLAVQAIAVHLLLKAMGKITRTFGKVELAKLLNSRKVNILLPFIAVIHLVVITSYDAKFQSSVIKPFEERRMRTVEEFLDGSEYKFILRYDVSNENTVRMIQTAFPTLFANLSIEKVQNLFVVEPGFQLMKIVAEDPVYLHARMATLKGIIPFAYVGRPGGQGILDSFFSWDSNGDLQANIGNTTCFYLTGMGFPLIQSYSYIFQLSYAERAWGFVNHMSQSGISSLYVRWWMRNMFLAFFKKRQPSELYPSRDWHPMPLLESRLRSILEITGSLVCVCMAVVVAEMLSRCTGLSCSKRCRKARK